MQNAILTGRFSVYGIVCFSIALTLLFTPFVSAALTDGLVLHHAYDEGEGTLAADASGNGHDGEISNPGLGGRTDREGTPVWWRRQRRVRHC